MTHCRYFRRQCVHNKEIFREEFIPKINISIFDTAFRLSV